MIYGIKQIEKQFPGFEARWTGGIVYDIKEALLQTYNRKNEGFLSANNIEQYDSKMILDHWDIIRPVNDKCYLIGRDSKDSQGRMIIEIAIRSHVAEKTFMIDEMYVVVTEFMHGTHKSLARRYRNIPVNCTDTSWDVYYRDAKTRHELFGDTSSLPIGMADWLWDTHEETTRSDLGAAIHTALIGFFFLNVRNIKQRTSYVSQQRDFYYPKAWGREYKVLSLSQTLMEHSPGPDLPPGYHVRGHFQRGHWKRKKTGVYWWNPHWRGDFSKGIVIKDCKVKVAPCLPRVPRGE